MSFLLWLLLLVGGGVGVGVEVVVVVVVKVVAVVVGLMSSKIKKKIEMQETKQKILNVLQKSVFLCKKYMI